MARKYIDTALRGCIASGRRIEKGETVALSRQDHLTLTGGSRPSMRAATDDEIAAFRQERTDRAELEEGAGDEGAEGTGDEGAEGEAAKPRSRRRK